MRGLMEYLKISDDKEKEKESNSAGKDGAKVDGSSIDFGALSAAMLDKPAPERSRRGSFLSLGRLWGNGEGEETKRESQQQECKQQSGTEGKVRTGKDRTEAMDQQHGEATSETMEDLNEKTVTLKLTVPSEEKLSLNALGLMQVGQRVGARAGPETDKPTIYDMPDDHPFTTELGPVTSSTPTSERAHRTASAMPRSMPVQQPDLRMRDIYGSMSSGMSSGTVSSFYSLASPTDTSFGSFMSFGDEGEQREQEEGDRDGRASVGDESEGWAGDRAEEHENENDGDNDGAVELNDLSEEGRRVMEEVLEVVGDDQAIVLVSGKRFEYEFDCTSLANKHDIVDDVAYNFFVYFTVHCQVNRRLGIANFVVLSSWKHEKKKVKSGIVRARIGCL